jgi:acetolactate synthase-1/2/3 large subunit
LIEENEMEMTGAEIIIKLLERQGITHIAGMPGGANLPMYDALYHSAIKHVLARHEQGAGFMAQGIARTTGKPAVCFATSGPGATNLITAIADAKLDSIPLIAITGQVPLAMIGTDAFQEVDTYGLTVPITKHNFLVRSAAELLEVIPEAFRIAMSGRPGPVVVDVPKDVQLQKAVFDALPEPVIAGEAETIDETVIDAMVAMIESAKRPLFFVGGGIVAAGASALVCQVAEKAHLPTVSTLMGLGAMPCDHPLFLGMLGMHGARYTNMALEVCDLIFAVGVRFDDRATGKVAHFCPQAKIIHIDIDASELGKIKQPVLSLVADAKVALQMLCDRLPNIARPDWVANIHKLKMDYPLATPGDDDVFQPYGVIAHVANALDETAVVTTDVGQHQMWVAQAFPFQKAGQLLTSGGLGTMGFGVPAAIGAALARPDCTVVCFSGDGSFLMNVQELATLAEENLNVKIVVMNNGYLGMVRQQQTLFYGGREEGSFFQAQPNPAHIARAFGVPACDLGDVDDPVGMLQEMLRAPGPCVINAPIGEDEMVFPMVPPGAANKDMIAGVAHANA